MIASTTLSTLGLAALLAGEPPAPALAPNESSPAQPEAAPAGVYAPRARPLFIASGIALGLAFIGESVGAGLAFNCAPGDPCASGSRYTWGSDEAGARFTFISSGRGTAYVGARLVALPVIGTGTGLLLAGSYRQARLDHVAGRPRVERHRLARVLLGAGLGLWLGSRLARVGFARNGVCQELACVYGFDQATLGASRALALTGSALLAHDHGRRRLELGLGPGAGWGLALTGRF